MKNILTIVSLSLMTLHAAGCEYSNVEDGKAANPRRMHLPSVSRSIDGESKDLADSDVAPEPPQPSAVVPSTETTSEADLPKNEAPEGAPGSTTAEQPQTTEQPTQVANVVMADSSSLAWLLAAQNGAISTTPQATMVAAAPQPEYSFAVSGIQMNFLTGTDKDAETQLDREKKILFTLCPGKTFKKEACYRAEIRGRGYSEFKKGKIEWIEHRIENGADRLHDYVSITGRRLEDLKYPRDFKYFKVESTSDDGWLMQGVELRVQFKGKSDWTTIYRNPCVGRWIQKDGDIDQYSFHSIENDQAFCSYFETSTPSFMPSPSTNTDPDCRMQVDLRLSGGSRSDTPFSHDARAWQAAYNTAADETDRTKIMSLSASSAPSYDGNVGVRLGYEAIDDFKSGVKTSYSWTVPDYNCGAHCSPDVAYKLHCASQGDTDTNNSDDMKFKRAIWHFMPGRKEFLADGKCLYHSTFSTALNDELISLYGPHEACLELNDLYKLGGERAFGMLSY